MNKNNIEVSVKEAAEMIGVSTRSIINYIKAKEIAAIKVGKSWFIKEPSLIAFSQRHGISIGQNNNNDEPETEDNTENHSLQGMSRYTYNCTRPIPLLKPSHCTNYTVPQKTLLHSNYHYID